MTRTPYDQAYMTKTREAARDKGYVETLFGRRYT
jgi:DNA polymerase I-like protein with 3'-5' exonuclease and polymerase domains